MDAVVVQPWGAYPTSTYGYYEHDGPHIREYQAAARAGGRDYEHYLQEHIYDCADFDEFLAKVLTQDRRKELMDVMHSLM